MPVMQTAHIDRALTNMSVAYIQDASNFVADKIFPVMSVTRQSDLYYIYKREDFLRDEARERGAISESAGGDYGLETDVYYCKKYAFHKDIAPEERLNYDQPLDADIDANIFVTNKMLIRRENVFTEKFFTPGVWNNEVTGVAGGTTPTAGQTIMWNYETSNPIADITNASILMASKTGYRPNVLLLSPWAFYALKNHPDILDRIKYTERGIVTADLLASLFEVQKVVVGWSVANSAVQGAAENTDFIAGKHALLAYVAPRPMLRSPSAGYIYSWNGLPGNAGYGARVNRIPMPILGMGVERIEAEMAFDIRQCSADLAVFFNGIVDSSVIAP